jgi:hypothetical protein
LQAEAEEIVRQRDAKAKAEVEKMQVGSSSKGIYYCKACSKAGHNKHTCKNNAVEVDN